MKSFKNLLIPLIALILLLIGTLLWFILKPDEKQEGEFNSNIVYLNTSDIKNLSVESAEGDSISAEAEYVDGVRTWSLVGINMEGSVKYSQSNIDAWAVILSQFVANSKVEEQHEDLSEYGLANPRYTVTILLNDGSSHKIYLGNNTYDGTYVYFMHDDDPQVYTVVAIKAQYAAFSRIDFIDSCVFSIDYNNIATVLYERDTDGFQLLATCDISDTGKPVYHIVEPFDIDASSYFANLIQYAAELEIAKFVNLSDQQIQDYGLDNPAFHFNFVMDDGTKYDLYLSRNIGGFFYGYTNITEGYFSMSEMQFKGLETPILTLIDSYVNYESVSDISSIKYSSDDLNFNFEIDTKDSISSDEAKVLIDLRNAKITSSDDRSYAAVLYEALACIDIGGIDLEAKPEFNSSICIKYYRDDYETTTLDFVVRDNESYYVFANGDYTGFYVYNREFEHDGGTNTYDYGIIPAYNLLNTAISNAINGIYDIPEA